MPGQGPFEIEPLPATFGAVVRGLTVAGLDDAAFGALREAWLAYALLIFPDQHLTRDEQIAFGRRFGPLEVEYGTLRNIGPDGAPLAPDHEMIRVNRGNMDWHCDSTYLPVQAAGAVFSADVVPPAGGETAFADLSAAYDALTPELRGRVEGLSARHSLRYSQGRLGYRRRPAANLSDIPAYGRGMEVEEPPLRPLVKVHPETGRKSLNVGRHAFGIPALAPEESERLIAELIAFAARPPRVWAHAWTVGDVILWDNRRLMHRVQPWDMSQPRVMRHTRIAGDPVAEFAAPA